MFKALLLAVWHDLSDVKLAEAPEDRASFRRFGGFSSSEPTPERSAFVRFRQVVIAHGLDRVHEYAALSCPSDAIRAVMIYKSVYERCDDGASRRRRPYEPQK